MPGPFYNNIQGTASGTPGTGAFTPSGAVLGSAAWSTVPAGWIGLVRYEDGTAAELSYGYWDGTTITRPADGFVWSTTGARLNLTSAATASLIIDGWEVQPHVGGQGWSAMIPVPSVASLALIGTQNVNLGTVSLEAISATNYMTEQPRLKWTSATTAHAAAGLHMGTPPKMVFSTAAGRGGGEFVCRFGASQLPTSPKLWCGLGTAINASTGEPSSYTNLLMLGKDSTDGNLQLMHNDGAGACTKVDTGIVWAINGWYEISIWYPPGGGKACFLLVRIDTGAIFYREVTTDLPANGSLLIPFCYGSLSATTGTAIVVHIGTQMTRAGG